MVLPFGLSEHSRQPKTDPTQLLLVASRSTFAFVRSSLQNASFLPGFEIEVPSCLLLRGRVLQSGTVSFITNPRRRTAVLRMPRLLRATPDENWSMCEF